MGAAEAEALPGLQRHHRACPWLPRTGQGALGAWRGRSVSDLRALARQLAQISVQVRDLGDVQLVLLGADGVGPAGVTLADELWLIAYQLDVDAATVVSREAGRGGGAA